ncbi:transmembrane protein 182 isoform X1 [Brienomyrus brachyistius]|uniref:transmembrane protein 182 isoform X1 n=1 Tax=Brienomyrus brachyistius TaxID=42636 RepID=UPI0020B298B4|nr:transmembrane protein 182 isoform X1 [Brienomyrus brachyistius]
MKLSVALFFAGFFGALSVLFFLLSFGTDYWLLASETCSPEDTTQPILEQRGDEVLGDEDTTGFHHEGFFWRCSFNDKSTDDPLLKTLLFNQPFSKKCVQSYLQPFPIVENNGTVPQSAIIYRGFWSVFMLLGVVTAVAAGFIIICAAPFASHRLYKAGGGLFLIAGMFFLTVIVMFIIWIQVLGFVDEYVDQKQATCANYQFNFRYGLSFMFAPVGVFFSLFAGLLFFLIGRSVQMQYH